MAVLKSYRGKGIGTRLLKRAIVSAKNRTRGRFTFMLKFRHRFL